MAPSTSKSTSVARKRRRPAFSPPRPKASKTPNTNGTAKRRGRPPGSTNSKTSKQTSSKKPTSATTSRTPSITVSINSSPISSVTSSPITTAFPNDDEPDYLLAEITTTDPDSASPVSHDLIQRIMHQAYQEPDKTTIAKDAKELVGKYVEIFVKEAIARCVHERAERDAESGGGGDGWLEVEDLERCAGQLVLDF